MVKQKRGMTSVTALLLAILLMLAGCQGRAEISDITITNCDRTVLEVGDTLLLMTDAPEEIEDALVWEASNDAVTVNDGGLVTAVAPGKVAVIVTYGIYKDSAMIEVVPEGEGNSNSDFYGDYVPARSYEEAQARSAKGQLSGLPVVPDQAPTVSAYQPATDYGALVRNSVAYYADDNTYVVVDAYGEEAFRVYRGGGYITLEEVAAYVYAFGDVPANYVSSKNKEPEDSIWGEYLRLNHTKFNGDTQKYPYEPALPDINGCGGDLQYYEIDIGTTGTDCDPAYATKLYNNGQTITRGAARIVYTRYDKNEDEIIDPNEKYVFYTYNHYNDFQEYLNYYGGWGEMFGNITGGGTISSKSNYNPTPYVPVVRGKLEDYLQNAASVACGEIYGYVLWTDKKHRQIA